MASRVRSQSRQPWVLYGLFALILAFSGSYHMNADAGASGTDAAVLEAVEFYRSNSALEPSRKLNLVASKTDLQDIARSHSEERADADFVAMPERLQARTQERFDALVDRAFELYVEGNPGWSYGLTGRGDTPRRYATHVFYHESSRAYLVTLLFLGLAGFVGERALGSLFFGLFCLMSASLTAVMYRTFHIDLGMPWCGPVGIISGLVGLYAVIGFRGAAIPGWLVLPAWLAAETLLVREAWIGGPESLPVYALGSGVGFGIAVGVLIPMFRNSAASESERSPEDRRKSLLGRATELRAANKSAEALDLLEAAAKKAAGDRQLVESYWELAVELGQARRAAPTLVHGIRAQIRANATRPAVAAWIALTDCVDDCEIDTTSLVKLGELLLDEGHPERAIKAMQDSLTSTPPLSSVLALRVVNVARDLDSDLTARAVAIALTDEGLNSKTAEDLRGLAATAAISAKGPAAASEAWPEPEPVPASPIAAKSAEPDADEDTHSLFGSSTDQDLALADDVGDPDGFSGEDLDPDAITPEALEDCLADISDSDLGDLAELGELGDLGDPADLAEPPDGTEFDPEDMSSLDPNALSLSDLSADASADDTAPTTPAVVGTPEDDDAVDSGAVEDAVLANADVELTPDLRRVKLICGIPLVLDEASLKFEMEGGSKSRVPLSRVQAIAVGTVAGVSARPVILVDLVLNWLQPENGELKIIRLRSDQFSPTTLVANAGTPINAMRAFLKELIAGTEATCLPDAAAVRGEPFASFADLDQYMREVLSARS